MDKQPHISIIVPVYNGQKWLLRCLESIATQTFSDWECILVDDGSSDSSGQICDQQAKKDSRFKVIHEENGGISEARNAGLDAAIGFYVCFCDQDDMFSPLVLEYALQVQQAEPDCLVWWDYSMEKDVFEENSKLGLRYTRESRWEVEPFSHYTLAFSTIWNKLFLRTMLEEHRVRFDKNLGIKGNLGEDDDFMAQILKKHYKGENFWLAHIKLPLYYYQDNQESLSHISHQEEAPTKTVEEPESKYCQFLLEEYEEKFKRVPTLLEKDPAEVACMVRNYMRSLAFGIWSAQQLKEPLQKKVWRNDVLKKMMAWCKKNKIYIPYYMPLWLSSKKFIAAYFYWDTQRDLWFWRFNWLFRKILFQWKEPAGIKR